MKFISTLSVIFLLTATYKLYFLLCEYAAGSALFILWIIVIFLPVFFAWINIMIGAVE